MNATTATSTFDRLASGQFLLAVTDGHPVDDVLEMCSCRLSEAIEFLRQRAELGEGMTQNDIYVAEALLEPAKAMVDACSAGLLRGEKP